MANDLDEAAARARIEAAARSWLGTPYHIGAAVKGAGVDCGELLRAVYVEAGIVGDFATEVYPPGFFLHDRRERLLAAVLERAREIAEPEVKPGDVVLYRFGHVYAHGAIVVSPGWPGAIVHAHAQSRCVLVCGGRDGELGARQRQPRFFSRWP